MKDSIEEHVVLAFVIAICSTVAYKKYYYFANLCNITVLTHFSLWFLISRILVLLGYILANKFSIKFVYYFGEFMSILVGIMAIGFGLGYDLYILL
jgi:pheromone shutdown protein TraB